jgi:hypothetical protein
LLSGEDVKIVYDEPWFWKCTMSTMEKPADRERIAPRPRIDLGEGVRSLSRYDRDENGRREEHDQKEHPNENQLCNMDPEDE